MSNMGKSSGNKVDRLDREKITIHLKTIILSLVVVFIYGNRSEGDGFCGPSKHL